jgi:hypothetical protein
MCVGMRFGGRGLILVVWLRVGLLLVSILTLVFGYFGVVFGAGTRSSARTCSVCIGIAAAASKGNKLQRIRTNILHIKEDMRPRED